MVITVPQKSDWSTSREENAVRRVSEGVVAIMWTAYAWCCIKVTATWLMRCGKFSTLPLKNYIVRKDYIYFLDQR